MAPPADPWWYDYLAFPIAPLLLLVQFGTLFARDRRVRRGLAAAIAVTLIAMFAYVATLDLDASEGANIGAGVLFLAVLSSIAMLPFAGIRAAVTRLGRSASCAASATAGDALL